MRQLNIANGADQVCLKYEKKCLEEFEGPLVAVVMGVAYGGDLERIARDVWGERGTVYGYDVFEDLHPKHLSVDVNNFEATCMDYWYATLGTNELSESYQRIELDRQGLRNVYLIKGEVHKDSCKDIEKIHYAFLDMDIIASMRAGYSAVVDKIVPGGYLLLHDVYQNIQSLGDWYENELKTDPQWEMMEEKCLTGVLRKKHV